MKITVALRYNYGQETFYPADEAAQTFASIAGTKTLRPSDLRKIQSLGFEVECRLNSSAGPIVGLAS